MKSLKHIISVIAIILATSLYLNAQAPPPPNGGTDPNDPESGNTAVGEAAGGGAPISGGGGILLALGAAYGVKRFYAFKKAEA